MIGLDIRFLAGRFHGNGWYHAHNEGVPEWPPSPWRILRALVSAAYSAGVSPSEAAPLIEKFCCLPRYRLPRAAEAHTRHYMPDTEDASHKRAKVFDAFVAVEGGACDPRPVLVGWPVSLDQSERVLFARLCRHVTYLGRAESWTDITPTELSEADGWDCWPDEQAQGSAATSVLAPCTAEALREWSRTQAAPKKGRDVPRTLWDVLTFDGERYRSEGWSGVPGTRFVRYVFGAAPFERSAIPRSSRSIEDKPTIARFAIRSAVLPKHEDAISVGERLRRAAMSRSRAVSGDAHFVFSGHGHEASGHRHAMYLSTSEDPRNAGYIDHLTISATAGFDEDDVQALQQLRRLWGRDGHDLELVLVGLGRADELGGFQLPRTRVLAKSTVWESITPFVPTRHPKLVRGVWVDSIEEQLRRACEQLTGLAPIEVVSLGDRALWSRYRRRRSSGGGNRGPDQAHGARLVFAEPVSGPIALGFGAHFGLGLFAPAERCPAHLLGQDAHAR